MEKTTLIFIVVIVILGGFAGFPYVRGYLLRGRGQGKNSDTGISEEEETREAEMGMRAVGGTQAEALGRVLQKAQEKMSCAVSAALQETQQTEVRCTGVAAGAKQIYETAVESGFFSVDLIENAKTEWEQAVTAEKQTEEILALMREMFQISMETNRLAMNISIEAARAGDRGKQIGQSAYEIRMLVERSKRATGKMSKEMREIKKSVTDMEASSRSFLSLMENRVVVDHDSFVHMAERYMEDVRLCRQSAADSSASVRNVEDEMEDLGRAIDSTIRWLKNTGERRYMERTEFPAERPLPAGMIDLEESSRRLSETIAAFRVKN